MRTAPRISLTRWHRAKRTLGPAGSPRGRVLRLAVDGNCDSVGGTIGDVISGREGLTDPGNVAPLAALLRCRCRTRGGVGSRLRPSSLGHQRPRVDRERHCPNQTDREACESNTRLPRHHLMVAHWPRSRRHSMTQEGRTSRIDRGRICTAMRKASPSTHVGLAAPALSGSGRFVIKSTSAWDDTEAGGPGVPSGTTTGEPGHQATRLKLTTRPAFERRARRERLPCSKLAPHEVVRRPAGGVFTISVAGTSDVVS